VDLQRFDEHFFTLGHSHLLLGDGSLVVGRARVADRGVPCGGVIATDPSPVLSAVLLMVTITMLGYVIGRMGLETSSVWPAIVVLAAWNATIMGHSTR
jgi:hypothetical protein